MSYVKASTEVQNAIVLIRHPKTTGNKNVNEAVGLDSSTTYNTIFSIVDCHSVHFLASSSPGGK